MLEALSKWSNLPFAWGPRRSSLEKKPSKEEERSWISEKRWEEKKELEKMSWTILNLVFCTSVQEDVPPTDEVHKHFMKKCACNCFWVFMMYAQWPFCCLIYSIETSQRIAAWGTHRRGRARVGTLVESLAQSTRCTLFVESFVFSEFFFGQMRQRSNFFKTLEPAVLSELPRLATFLEEWNHLCFCDMGQLTCGQWMASWKAPQCFSMSIFCGTGTKGRRCFPTRRRCFKLLANCQGWGSRPEASSSNRGTFLLWNASNIMARWDST